MDGRGEATPQVRERWIPKAPVYDPAGGTVPDADRLVASEPA